MQSRPNVCLSYSCNKKYLSYLERSLVTLSKNSPDCFAYVDLINCNITNSFNNIKITTSNIDTENKKAIKKWQKSCHLKEFIVPYSGAYANLKKVYNIYNLLESNEYNYVLNMDADNLILSDLLNYELFYQNDFDIAIRFRDEPLFGEELLKRTNDFKLFDLSMINLKEEDRRFREGCFIVRNNETTKRFFKFIQDNILNLIEWYADSYWFLRAFQLFKNEIRIKKLQSNFVAYDLENELKGALVASGYGLNKHSELYKKLTESI